MILDSGAVALVVAALAVGGIIAWRAAREPRDRGVWCALGVAAVLTTAVGPSAAPGAGRAPGWAVGAPLAVHVLVLVLLYGAQLRLLTQRLAVHVPGSVLDTLGGLTMVLALGFTLLLHPLRTSPGLGAAAAWALVVSTSLALLVTGFSTGTVFIGGRAAEPRSWLVTAAAAVLLVEDVAATAERLGGPGLGGPGAVAAVHLLPGLLLAAAAALAPPPVLPQADEDAHVVLLGPLLYLAVAGAVLGWAHAARVSTSAVVASLACLVVVGVKVVLVFARITTLNDTQREAVTDELTGLGNRRALVAALALVDDGRPAALVLVDLDGFKEVNDRLGHAAGDELLRQVAARMRSATDPTEQLVRQGGDEFALVLPGAGTEEALERAGALLAQLLEPFDLRGREVRVAASLGVAAAPEHAADPEELQRRADSAMYRAKAAGGGVRVADRAADDAGRREASLAADLRAAVATGALVAHFQPQLDAATGDLAGVEALVRWPHPELGLLGPERFLGLAEALGLMGELTRLVLHQALAQVAPLRGGAPARVSVNVSASSLLDPDLATDVAAALLEHGVAPEELVLEITESELMQDAGECLRVVHALVELGVGVSIDDYGTGHSSLAYLRYLPAVELKLDRSFADDLCRDERLADIVRTTIDLAHTLGMRLVAEGVEDEETLVRLRELGADVTQGHHHAAPVPGPELTAWVAAHRARRAAARAAAPVEAPAG